MVERILFCFFCSENGDKIQKITGNKLNLNAFHLAKLCKQTHTHTLSHLYDIMHGWCALAPATYSHHLGNIKKVYSIENNNFILILIDIDVCMYASSSRKLAISVLCVSCIALYALIEWKTYSYPHDYNDFRKCLSFSLPMLYMMENSSNQQKTRDPKSFQFSLSDIRTLF
jgi:hypothetical protein